MSDATGRNGADAATGTALKMPELAVPPVTQPENATSLEKLIEGLEKQL